MIQIIVAFIFTVLSLSQGQGQALAATTLAKAHQRMLLRLKKQCELDGIGYACFQYAKGLNPSSKKDKNLSKEFYVKGCRLNYKPACEILSALSVRTQRVYRPKLTKDANNRVGKCFSLNEMNNVHLTPNEISNVGVLGQKLTKIKAGSFWAQAGFKENDVLVRANNMPFNSHKEAMAALSSSGKRFGFEVLRDGSNITLWYSCH